LISALKEFFKKRGYQLILPEELKVPSEFLNQIDVAVRDANNLIFVKVFSGPPSRTSFTNTAMKASSLRAYADKIYLAAPKELRIMIDGNVLLENGIGLLLVDRSGKVEEALPPRPTTRRAPIISVNEVATRLVSEVRDEVLSVIDERLSEIVRMRDAITALQSRVSELERRLARLEREIERVTREAPRLVSRGITIEERVAPISEEVAEGLEELPSYLRDNPWVEILSRRGREEK